MALNGPVGLFVHFLFRRNRAGRALWWHLMVALLGLGREDVAGLAGVEEVQDLACEKFLEVSGLIDSLHNGFAYMRILLRIRAVDTLEHFSGEGAAERPANVEGDKHVAHLVGALRYVKVSKET